MLSPRPVLGCPRWGAPTAAHSGETFWDTGLHRETPDLHSAMLTWKKSLSVFAVSVNGRPWGGKLHRIRNKFSSNWLERHRLGHRPSQFIAGSPNRSVLSPPFRRHMLLPQRRVTASQIHVLQV
jgi:hypothetical protein